MYPEAAKAAVRVTDPNLTKHVSNLLAVIAFEQDNLPGNHTAPNQTVPRQPAVDAPLM
jgi:hypothetical protein